MIIMFDYQTLTLCYNRDLLPKQKYKFTDFSNSVQRSIDQKSNQKLISLLYNLHYLFNQNSSWK